MCTSEQGHRGAWCAGRRPIYSRAGYRSRLHSPRAASASGLDSLEGHQGVWSVSVPITFVQRYALQMPRTPPRDTTSAPIPSEHVRPRAELSRARAVSLSGRRRPQPCVATTPRAATRYIRCGPQRLARSVRTHAEDEEGKTRRVRNLPQLLRSPSRVPMTRGRGPVGEQLHLGVNPM